MRITWITVMDVCQIWGIIKRRSFPQQAFVNLIDRSISQRNVYVSYAYLILLGNV